ncbi:MAG: hypothetical protein J6T10_28180 [Methanobrevibacter sp.]|nr:hypothetical protein [Methanobrevibacter sp.]
MRKFTADFETTTNVDNTHVWAYGISEIGNPDNFIYGTKISDFILWCYKQKDNPFIFFHNLKFDGVFILNYLLSNGYTYFKDKKDKKDKSFTCLISGDGLFYSLEIYFKTGRYHDQKVSIYDSLKILNMSVDKVAKSFKLPIGKLEIDYSRHNNLPEGSELTKEEVAYLRNDVEIMSRALDVMFTSGLTKMTIGSDALTDYKNMNKYFNNFFPVVDLELDKDLRESYRGGFTYLNPKYKFKETGKGIVLDVNSLYPSVLHNELMPYDMPVYFKGKYESDKDYPLYIQKISCSFKIKPNKIPCIQLKNYRLAFMENEYVEDSNGEIYTFTLTNVDLELFLKQYDIDYIEYEYGFKFKGIKGLFSSYIDKWTEEKIKAKKEGNSGMYTISKLLLNSLYGKFGTNPNTRRKYPYLEDGIVKFSLHEMETKDPIYVPIASFCTSYARRKTIETSQAIRDYSMKKYGVDKYIYSDTDSIHCLFDVDEIEDGVFKFKEEDKELNDIIDIDDYRLGAWKIESKYVKGKYIRQKCYIELGYDDKLNVVVAGLPKKLAHKVNFDNFNENLSVGGKLTFKHTKGGIVLVETTFTIK